LEYKNKEKTEGEKQQCLRGQEHIHSYQSKETEMDGYEWRGKEVGKKVCISVSMDKVGMGARGVLASREDN